MSANVAPIPKNTGKTYFYFPTQVGTGWVYEQNWGDDYVETVTAVEEKGGRYLVTVATTSLDDPDGLQPGIMRYLVSEEGVFVTGSALESETDRKEHDPPFRLLKLPFRAGDKWGSAESSGGESVMAKIETVKVPAGTFETIRVDGRVAPNQIGEGNYSFWYAPRVGAVKKKVNDKLIQMKSITLPEK